MQSSKSRLPLSHRKLASKAPSTHIYVLFQLTWPRSANGQLHYHQKKPHMSNELSKYIGSKLKWMGKALESVGHIGSTKIEVNGLTSSMKNHTITTNILVVEATRKKVLTSSLNKWSCSWEKNKWSAEEVLFGVLCNFQVGIIWVPAIMGPTQGTSSRSLKKRSFGLMSTFVDLITSIIKVVNYNVHLAIEVKEMAANMMTIVHQNIAM